jgi:transposase InsO family protein
MQFIAQLGAIVGLVAEHVFRWLHSADEALREGQSCASPPVSRIARRRRLASASACIFVLRPPRERPTDCFCSPLFPPAAERCAFTCVESIICVSVDRPFPASSRNRFSQTAPRPAHKAVIDRCRRTILGRATAPATAALQHVHDAADDAAIIHPLDAPDIRGQARFDPLPLLIAQPKQVSAHDPNSPSKTNQDRIVRAEKLICSDPSLSVNA